MLIFSLVTASRFRYYGGYGRSIGVFGEKVTFVSRSQLIKRLEDHNLRLITNEFFDGLPTQPFDKRSARGIKAAIGYDSGSTILKFLQPVNFCRTGTTPNRAAVSKVGLNDARVKSHQTFELEQKFLDHINSYHPNIKFTVELEMDDTLPFLDVSVTHDQSSFSTSLYRKKTFTGLYTDFGTLSPNKYKVNLIRVLVFHICSTYSNFHAEVVRIKGILKENCFPVPLIDRVIKTFLDKQFSKKPPPAREEKQFLIFCLPFLGSYSLQIKTKLTRLFKQCYPDVKLKVIFNSPKRLSSYFRFKDRFSILMCSSVVYSYKCPGCHALYYGKTTRNLDTRCREHLGINKAGQKIKSNCSAIGDHISKFGHNGSLEDFDILSKTENSFDLLIHESLLILRDHPSLNSQQSSIPLLLF